LSFHFQNANHIISPKPQEKNLQALQNILTPVGYKPIETLSKGDLVVTDKRKVVPISAIYSMHYDVTTKETAPYTIKKNAFGHNSLPAPASCQRVSQYIVQRRRRFFRGR
jgi:hypothetical protein